MPEKPSPSKLLQIINTHTKDLSKCFREYDTAIVGGGNYHLDPGNCILLLLLTESGQLWTTIRRHTSWKEEYYGTHIGKKFDIIIDEQDRYQTKLSNGVQQNRDDARKVV